MSTWKRDFASGLVVLVPLIITIWVVYWLFGWIQRLSPTGMVIDNPALEVVVTLAIVGGVVMAVGYLMRTAVGTLVEGLIDETMNRLPGLRVVYNATKMAVETAVSDSTQLQKPVKLYTWDGIRMTAFKTGRQAPDNRELLFLPTAPNITSGFVIEVEEDDLIETGESVEDALTRILSAGFGERNPEQATTINVTPGSEDDQEPQPVPIERGSSSETD